MQSSVDDIVTKHCGRSCMYYTCVCVEKEGSPFTFHIHIVLLYIFCLFSPILTYVYVCLFYTLPNSNTTHTIIIIPMNRNKNRLYTIGCFDGWSLFTCEFWQLWRDRWLVCVFLFTKRKFIHINGLVIFRCSHLFENTFVKLIHFAFEL